MESPQLLLNEAKMASLEDSKKSIFLFDWLKKLDIVLRNLTTSAQSTQISQNPEALIQDKEAVRKSQKQLVDQRKCLLGQQRVNTSDQLKVTL